MIIYEDSNVVLLSSGLFGKNHAHFVKALLFYCNFSNEFIQDESTLKISNVCQIKFPNRINFHFIINCICEFSKYTLELAKKIYGYNSLAVADAYKVCSKALIINKHFQDNRFYDYASKALKIATEHYSSKSIKLIPFQMSLGKQILT